MDTLQTIKLELISQKVAIENKGGIVQVANSNPSPGEITEGIKTIPVPEFSKATASEEDVVAGKTFFSGNDVLKLGTKEIPNLTLATATSDDVVAGKTFYSGDDTIKTGTKEIPNLTLASATEEDVLVGKTFYSGSNEIKTGTFVDRSDDYNKIFLSADSYNGEKMYFTIPQGIKELKTYLLYEQTGKNVELTFNTDLEKIGEYDFYGCENISFTNFAELENIKELGNFSFAYLPQCPIDFENLPTSLEVIGTRCFYDSIPANKSIKLHSGLTSIGNYSFAVSSKTEVKDFIIPDDINLTQLPGYMLENLIFDCDFRVPSGVKSLVAGFAYGCSFNNITIPATCTTFGNGVFYCSKTESASYRKLKTVTFESSTPPTFGTYVFAEQDKTNGFKIYVPDNAVTTYKTNNRLSSFANYIFPISQKE